MYKKVSDSEIKVLDVLWEQSPLTSSEIISRLKNETDWNSKTIHTFIRRLVSKGAVGAEKEGSYYKYFSLVSREQVRKNETKTLLKKMYDGSISMLVASFIKDEELPEEELDELKKLLDDVK